MNSPVTASSRCSPVRVSARVTELSLSAPLTAATVLFHANRSFGLARARSAMIRLARSSSRRWMTVTVSANFVRNRASSMAESPPPDDRDVLSAEEEPVAGRAPGDPVPGETLLVGQAELAVPGSHREDDGVGAVLGALTVHDDLDVAGQGHRGHVVGDQLGAEALGLGAQVVHQVRTHDPLGESGEVLDVGGVHQRPAGGDRALEHQRAAMPRARRRWPRCTRPGRSPR